MTLQERLNELYPVSESFTEQDRKIIMAAGVTEEQIEIIESRIKINRVINQKLREAYLLGRNESKDYE